MEWQIISIWGGIECVYTIPRKTLVSTEDIFFCFAHTQRIDDKMIFFFVQRNTFEIYNWKTKIK